MEGEGSGTGGVLLPCDVIQTCTYALCPYVNSDVVYHGGTELILGSCFAYVRVIEFYLKSRKDDQT